MTVVENPSKETRNQFQLFLRMNPWNDFSWLTMEGALVELPQLYEQKASPRPALRLFLGAYNLQKNCKDKSLTSLETLHQAVQSPMVDLTFGFVGFFLLITCM